MSQNSEVPGHSFEAHIWSYLYHQGLEPKWCRQATIAPWFCSNSTFSPWWRAHRTGRTCIPWLPNTWDERRNASDMLWPTVCTDYHTVSTVCLKTLRVSLFQQIQKHLSSYNIFPYQSSPGADWCHALMIGIFESKGRRMSGLPSLHGHCASGTQLCMGLVSIAILQQYGRNPTRWANIWALWTPKSWANGDSKICILAK